MSMHSFRHYIWSRFFPVAPGNRCTGYWWRPVGSIRSGGKNSEGPAGAVLGINSILPRGSSQRPQPCREEQPLFILTVLLLMSAHRSKPGHVEEVADGEWGLKVLWQTRAIVSSVLRKPQRKCQMRRCGCSRWLRASTSCLGTSAMTQRQPSHTARDTWSPFCSLCSFHLPHKPGLKNTD